MEKLTKHLMILLSVLLVILVGVIVSKYDLIGEKQMIVEIKTTLGTIEVELDEQHAPITVKNFLSYVDEDYYSETVFHRVIEGFMIQGGGFTENGKQKSTKASIKLESNNGLKNNKGTLAMARTNDPNSATSQFFINTVDNNFLNYAQGNPGYAVFAKVTKGMDVVEKIEQVQTGNRPMPDWPVEVVKILSIKRK